MVRIIFAAGDGCSAKHGTHFIYAMHPFLQHGGEKNLLKCAWAPDGEMVSAGSSDQAVHIWDEPSTQELYFLPGHTGSVNEVSKEGCRTQDT